MCLWIRVVCLPVCTLTQRLRQVERKSVAAYDRRRRCTSYVCMSWLWACVTGNHGPSRPLPCITNGSTAPQCNLDLPHGCRSWQGLRSKSESISAAKQHDPGARSHLLGGQREKGGVLMRQPWMCARLWLSLSTCSFLHLPGPVCIHIRGRHVHALSDME